MPRDRMRVIVILPPWMPEGSLTGLAASISGLLPCPCPVLGPVKTCFKACMHVNQRAKAEGGARHGLGDSYALPLTCAYSLRCKKSKGQMYKIRAFV